MDLQSGVKSWYNNSKVLIRNLGNEASEKAGDTWIGMDTKPLKDAAAKIRLGVNAPGAEPGSFVQLKPPTQAIDPYLREIDQLGDRLGTVTKDGHTSNAFEQYQAIRDNLYNLMTSAPDQATRDQARVLWQGTHDMLDGAASEINGKAGTQYTQSFKNSYNKFVNTYKDTEDAADTMRGLINARDPGAAATTLLNSKLKTIQTIKNALNGTPEQSGWDAIVNGVRSNLSKDIVAGESYLTKMQHDNPEILNEVMSPSEQEAWKSVGAIQREFNQSLGSKLSATDNTTAQNALKFAQTGNANEIQKYVNATGGVEGDFAAEVRNSMWKDILDGAKGVDKATGEDTIEADKLVSGINKYMSPDRKSALASTMTQKDWDTMSVMRRYAAIAGADMANVGASMHAASVYTPFTDWHGIATDKSHIGIAMLKMFSSDVTARVMSTPISRDMFTQAVGAPTMNGTIRLLARAAGFATQKAGHSERQQYQSTDVEREGLQ